ncbi:quercetin 2,3-dioxygenase [Phaeodactylibacter xiamenensis]|uniref:quercetin 2,3-dioxygenase n=1 Tax=Phaeodactylibacter xiamenensis TaxID=1524460 RepID=UPI0024A7E4E9|nr:quercetin 2,3-dioxygenase [Phaeodactylibacter xiamenensis]
MQMNLSPKVLKKGEGELLKVLQDNITVKVDGRDTYGQFTVVETNNEVDAGVPPHYHEREDECFYIIEGEAEFTVGGETFTARTGDTVFGPRNVPHSYRFLKPTKMLATISPAGFERMFREVHNMEDQSDLGAVERIFNNYGVYLVK